MWISLCFIYEVKSCFMRCYFILIFPIFSLSFSAEGEGKHKCSFVLVSVVLSASSLLTGEMFSLNF